METLKQLYLKKQQEKEVEQYRQFSASELFCPVCRQAMPVRERLLLVLPDGREVYDYVCRSCGESLGRKEG
ncbi:MAG: hypothetical protein D6719_11505 [Candidatus Dadabacteria bacterium]|nr:MAG: hypothetical protein D6719_11505 [Candidatus Dadabacteria bacterium]